MPDDDWPPSPLPLSHRSQKALDAHAQGTRKLTNEEFKAIVETSIDEWRRSRAGREGRN